MKRRFDITKPLRSALLAVLALGSVSCFGARPYRPVQGDPLIEPWRWRTFPELSGLDAQCMTEGTDGTIWFGTANGLWSYDGIEWVRSTDENAGRIVTALCNLPDGSLYVGGGWGISQFSNGKWTRLLSAPRSRIIDIADIPIKNLATGLDGSLWVATSWGALHREQSTWTLYTDPQTAERIRKDQGLPGVNVELVPETVIGGLRNGSVPSNRCDLAEICADRQGRIWFGTTGGEVLCYAPAAANATRSASRGTWSLYQEADEVGAGAITSILSAQDGSIWVVRAASEQAKAFDGQAWRTIHLPLFLPALDLADVGGKLLQTRNGVIWLSARFMLFAYQDGEWRKYGQPEVAYPSTRNVVMQSSDGALWFAGPNTEIYRVDYQTPRWLTLQDLNFQWQSPTGAQWFLHRDGRVVVHEADRWTSYGVEDGLMNTPVALLCTRSGEVWAAGSHDHTAATARFDGQKWTRNLHDDFSFAVDWRAVFEASDGSLWFGAFVDTDGPEKHRYGLLQFHDGVWTHHHQPGRSPRADGAENPATLLPPSANRDHPIEKFICLGESRDGKIWAGRNILVFYDGKKWEEFSSALKVRPGNIETMFTSRERDLWIGTRESGTLRYDGNEWRQYQSKDGLLANVVRSITQTADGSLWAATDRGVSRFDGRAWMADVLPEELNVPHEGGSLKASPSGQLWINRYTLYWMRRAWTKSPPPDPNGDFRTVCHDFQGPPPRTSITAGAGTISQPGNVAVLWSGVVPWREPKEARLQFSFRLDDQPWSAFTSDQGHSFFTVPSGRHHLEVRSRDPDFNVDSTPAILDFVVLPPVWRQAWFILLIALLIGSIVAQSRRVLLEQSRLRETNRELAGEVRVRERTEESLRRLNLELDQRVNARTAQLETANKELEAFSYSVSHDLRTPLRSIDGFSRVLLEDYTDRLDDEGRDYLQRVRAASQRMGRLIDDLLHLSRTTRTALRRSQQDLTALAQQLAADLAQTEPGRDVKWIIAPGMTAHADAALLRVVLQNLMSNAWKFTSRLPQARIEVGRTEINDEPTFYVRDNGAGFDMAYAGKLFAPFQRLHTIDEFPGTGIGLANVQRIVHRHGGRVWAEGKIDGGATFFFTLPEQSKES